MTERPCATQHPFENLRDLWAILRRRYRTPLPEKVVTAAYLCRCGRWHHPDAPRL